MKKLAGFLVNHRRVISAVVLVLTVVCGILALGVPINNDRTKYLPDKSNMKQGMDLMASVFPEAEEKSAIRLMVDGLSPGEIPGVIARLEAIENVSSVDYDAGSEDYNRGGHTLFVVNSRYAYNTPEELAIEAALETAFPEYETAYHNNDLPGADVPIWILVFAVVLAMIILTVMSRTWLDPFLILITLIAAVVINFGTNAVLPYIDRMTATVGPILQLTLSMDYSIILMNRYRQEKAACGERMTAMKTALAGSISSIASSALTTVAGLLALTFLSFKLGPELGIVLAKGVFISMLCVLTVLPTLVLAADKALEKTAKRAPHVSMGALSRFSYKARFVMPAVFVLLLAGAFILQRSTVITFADNSEDPLADIFPRENTVVLLYADGDEGSIPGIIDELEKDGNIKSVLGYPNTLGREMSAGEMAAAVGGLGESIPAGETVLRLLYYLHGGGGLPELTASEFLRFLTGTVMRDETLGEYLDGRFTDRAELLERLSDRDALTEALTAGEMAEFFGMEKETAAQVYLYHAIRSGVPDSGTMTLPAFVSFVLDTAAVDERYARLFDPEALSSLERLRSFTDDDSIRAARSASELSALLGLDADTVNTVFTLHHAGDISGKKLSVSEFASFLSGSVLQDPAFAAYFDDAAREQVQTLDGLIRLAVSGRALTPGQMAETLGMDAQSAAGLFALYFSEDPAFLQETAAMTVPLPDFLTLLKANVSGEQAEQLALAEELIALASSGQELSAEEMAAVTGAGAEEIAFLYLLNSAETMTLPAFLSAALALVPDHPDLQRLERIVRLTEEGAAADTAAYAEAFGLETGQVRQLFGLSLAAQKTVPLADFTGFLANTVLTNEAYAGFIPGEQAAQLRQMNGILRLAVSGEELDAAAMAPVFGMDGDMAAVVFRLYFGAGAGGSTMSCREFVSFLLTDAFLSGRLDRASREQLRTLQTLMDAAEAQTAFTSGELAGLLGMEAAQAEQLYILRMSGDGRGDAWTLSPRDFVSFAAEEVLGDEALSEYVDGQTAEELKLGRTLIDAVVSDETYTVGEMAGLLSSLGEEVSEDELEVLYLCRAGSEAVGPEERMTIPELFRFLEEELLEDARFRDFFDGETRERIRSMGAELEAAEAQMKSGGYSRLILTSDYPDESPETGAYIGKLGELCDESLGEYYLVGSSVMVSEMDGTFDREYLMITLITAIAVFLVVLIAFRNPVMPLLLTLLVQCGVFITVTVIGVYSGSIYYLALLIVQSILMGATIDYGIVFCNFYRENRKTAGAAEALGAAYQGSIHTIMTSGTIIVLVLAVLGIMVSSAMISEVCVTLGLGALIAILLILLVLPGLVACFDPLIAGKKKTGRP